MMTSTNNNSDPVPRAITSALRRLIRRLRILILFRGVLVVGAVLLASLLCVMGIDAFAPSVCETVWPRLALTISALALTVLSAILFLVRPLAGSFTMTGIARMIESRHPEMHERISSAIELLTSTDSREIRGSEVLIAALARQADHDARTVVPRREFTFRRVRLALVIALIASISLAVVLSAWPERSFRLMARAVAPFANLPNFYAHQLAITPSGDSLLMEGQKFRVEAAVPEGIETVEMRINANGSDETINEMIPSPVDRRRFAFTFPLVSENFRYRIRARDAWSRYYNVKVVPRPRVESISLSYKYPAYTRIKDRIVEDSNGDISAIAGTRVSVTFLTNTPISRAGVRVGEKAIPVEVENLGGGQGRSRCTFHFRIDPDCGSSWSVAPARRIGDKEFVGQLGRYGIEALPDDKPEVKMVIGRSRATSFSLNRRDRIDIFYRVSDRFGIAGAELLFEKNGVALSAVPLKSMQADGRGGFIGRAAIDLSSLGVETASVLNLRIRARDNRPGDLGGPQEGLSRLFSITFDDKAALLGTQIRLDEEIVIRRTLREILIKLRLAKEHSGALRKSQTGGGAIVQRDVAKADNLRKLLGEVRLSLGEMMADVSGGVYGGMTEQLGEVNSHVGRAHTLAGEVKLTDDAIRRAKLADTADFETGCALGLVEKMLGKFNVLAEMLTRTEELVMMNREQQMLADMAANMKNAGHQMTEAQWAKLQKELARQVGQMVRSVPDAWAAMVKKDRDQSASLTARAIGLSREQRQVRENIAKLPDLAKKIAQLQFSHQRVERKIVALYHKKVLVKRTIVVAEALKADGLAKTIRKWAKTKETGKYVAKRKKLRKYISARLAERRSIPSGELQRLRSRQTRLASEATDLAKRITKASPQKDHLPTRAAQSVGDTAKALRSDSRAELKRAAGLARKARVQLGRLARRLDAPKSSQSSKSQDRPPVASQVLDDDQASQSNGEFARTARKLANTQKALAEQIAAISGGNMKKLFTARQGQIASETNELVRDIALVREHAADMGLDWKAKQLVRDAQRHAALARRQSLSAARQMRQRKSSHVSGNQKAAEKALAVTAEKLAELGKQLARQRKPADDQQRADMPTPQQLAAAYEAAALAARNSQAAEAVRAAKLLSGLSRAAVEMARELGADISMSDLEGLSYAGGEGDGAGLQSISRALLRIHGLELTGDSWARTRGELHDDVLHQASEAQGPEEYRMYIRNYFREVSRRAGAAEPSEREKDKTK